MHKLVDSDYSGTTTLTKIALVGPSFFDYIQAIQEELISRGYSCIYFDERHSNSIASKLAYRLKLKCLLLQKHQSHINKILHRIYTHRITDVFLINVEIVGANFVSQLRSHGIRVHLYMWDSSSNKNSFVKLLNEVNTLTSFDPADCHKYGMGYIPLFAEKIFSASIAKKCLRKNELTFLGTLHSRRCKFLLAFENIAKAHGFSVRKLLYYHSKAMFLLKCLMNPLALRYLKLVRSTGFKKSEIALAYFESKAVLDVHHPGQTGLTSRTFESLRAGAWLITFNKTVLSLPPELQARTVLLSDLNELDHHMGKICEELPQLSSDAEYYLSLERFCDELLNASGLQIRSGL